MLKMETIDLIYMGELKEYERMNSIIMIPEKLKKELLIMRLSN